MGCGGGSGCGGGGGNVQAPPPRNLTREMLQTYQGFGATAQPYFNLESVFGPQYRQLDLGNLQQQLFGYNVPGGGRPATPGTPAGLNWAQYAGVGAPGAPGAAPAVNNAAAGVGPAPAAPTTGVPLANQMIRGAGGKLKPAVIQQFGPVAGSNLIAVPTASGKGTRYIQDPYAGAGQGAAAEAPGYHPGTLALGAAANTYQRGADINDVANLGPAATAAFLQANPFLAAGLTNLMGRTQDSPLLQMLNQQAGEGLAARGALSPQDVTAAQQSARAAYSARGLAGSSPAAAAEILNRDAAMRQRAAAAQQAAMGVQGLNQQQADLVARASQIFGGALGDPFQMILGRTAGMQLMPQYQQMFNPMNQYSQDLFNTNYNAQAASNIAGANASAAQGSGTMQLIGSILGAAATAY